VAKALTAAKSYQKLSMASIMKKKEETLEEERGM